MPNVRVQLSLSDAHYALDVIADELRLADDDGVEESDEARVALARIGGALLRAVERGESRLGAGHVLREEYQDQKAARELIRFAFSDDAGSVR